MIVRGPFTIKWGENEIQEIESVDIQYDHSSDDYETVHGKVFQIDNSIKISAVVTLLSNDIQALAILLPQYFVPYASELSTGETVSHIDGAIDIIPHRCDLEYTYNPLDIISCGNPAEVIRIVNARSNIDGIDIDNRLRKIRIKLIGESPSNQGVMQLYKEGAIDYGYLMTEEEGYLLFEDNGAMILELED